MKIEQKNTLFVIVLVIAVLAGVSSVVYILLGDYLDSELDARIENGRSVFVAQQREGLDRLYEKAHDLALQLSSRGIDHKTDELTLQNAINALGHQYKMEVAVIYLHSDPVIRSVYTRRDVLAKPQVISNDVFNYLVASTGKTHSATSGQLFIADTFLRIVVVPVKDTQGEETGILLLAEKIDDSAVEQMARHLGTGVMLISGETIIGSTFSSQPDMSMLAGDDVSGETQKFTMEGELYEGRMYILYNYKGGIEVARLLLATKKNLLWQPFIELARVAAWLSLLILLVVALAGIAVSRRWLSTPIKQLLAATNSIQHGNYKVPIKINSNDEIGLLSESLSEMQVRLAQLQQEEACSRQRFHDFAESSSDWLWETDATGDVTYVSMSVKKVLGYQPEELIGKRLDKILSTESMAVFSGLVKDKQHHEPFRDVEIWVNSADDIRYCILINAVPFYNDNQFQGYRGTARDVTKMKNDEQHLTRLANNDHLSGLSNRRRFLEDLEREISLALRNGSTGAVLLIDLDHFKMVNDTAGHAAGDEVIIQVSGYLRRIARSTDLIARLGGDEFCLALLGVTEEQAMERAMELMKGIASLKPTYGGKILNTTVSIGMSLYSVHGETPIELLAKADSAMYEAKQEGRDRLHLYDERAMTQKTIGSQLAWKDRMLDALEHDRLVLAFQPIVSTRNLIISRYEVLVRLRAEDGQIFPPGQFIPLAEEFGLISRIDKVIVRKALRAMKKQYEHNPQISFSINLSGRSVGDPDMLSLIEEELTDARFDRQQVTFEITESAAIYDLSRAIAFTRRIQQLGCRLALDDFGVGFSSFSYLKQLHADVLKIDGAFVRDIHNNEDDQLFVKALVDVSRGLNMKTVAEFVETQECLDMIRQLGVDYAQGYFVGKPVIGLFDNNDGIELTEDQDKPNTA
ncbi:MAG TPA: EAL domain-containing protein [Gammaproteobacteria bacterium]|nr:EAL domain-containing protein [Gammaproteobacteria bacterium]